MVAHAVAPEQRKAKEPTTSRRSGKPAGTPSCPVVDAKDAASVDFYRHHGFIQMHDGPPMLLVSIHPKWSRR